MLLLAPVDFIVYLELLSDDIALRCLYLSLNPFKSPPALRRPLWRRMYFWRPPPTAPLSEAPYATRNPTRYP